MMTGFSFAVLLLSMHFKAWAETVSQYGKWAHYSGVTALTRCTINPQNA